MDAKLQCVITHATALGGRNYQEDRYVAKRIEIDRLNVHKRGWFLAVMDGHGGSSVAEYVESNLPEIFSDNILFSSGEIPIAFQYSVRLLADATKNSRAGSTLSMVYVPEDEWTAYVSILGDSPVIIRDSKGGTSVSPEHNVRTNIAERDAAIKRGALYGDGYIWNKRYDAGLQMSRALGDRELDEFLSREPEIYSVNLNPQSFIVVASDGILDPSHSGEYDIENLVRKIINGVDASQLVAGHRDDNATAILSRFVDLSGPDSFRHR